MAPKKYQWCTVNYAIDILVSGSQAYWICMIVKRWLFLLILIMVMRSDYSGGLSLLCKVSTHGRASSHLVALITQVSKKWALGSTAVLAAE